MFKHTESISSRLDTIRKVRENLTVLTTFSYRNRNPACQRGSRSTRPRSPEPGARSRTYRFVRVAPVPVPLPVPVTVPVVVIRGRANAIIEVNYSAIKLEEVIRRVP